MHVALRPRLLRQLRSRRAAAVIEFALVATPFVFMLFAVIESGLIFVTQVNLSNATMTLARKIRTGNLVAAGLSSATLGNALSLADFKTAICASLQLVPAATCTAQLQVDLRTQASFGAGQSASVPILNLNFNNSTLCFFSGQGGSIVELRAFYLWSINTPVLLSALINATSYTVGNTTTVGSYHVMTSAEAFRIEPNSSGWNSGSGC